VRSGEIGFCQLSLTPGAYAATCKQDVLVHIRDISHPDTVAQKINVLETLQQQNVDSKLLDNMIEVCNKVDRLNERYTVVQYSHTMRATYVVSGITQ